MYEICTIKEYHFYNITFHKWNELGTTGALQFIPVISHIFENSLLKAYVMIA